MVVLVVTAAICVLSLVSAVPPVWYNGVCGVSKYADAGEYNLPQKIVGGIDARPHEFPWQVSVRRKSSGAHFCGGEVISENWIMCAGHCMEGETPAVVSIAAGEHRRNNPDAAQQIKDVSAIFMHPQYNPNTVENDISLIKLSTPLDINDDVRPVCAPDDAVDYTHWKSQVSGWGSTRSGGPCCQQTLQYTTVNITTNTFCQGVYVNDPITADMICATDNNGSNIRDSCQGDSGGPLTVKEADGTFRDVGIVSWGIGCASGYPGVYTRVTHFNDWVTNIINTN